MFFDFINRWSERQQWYLFPRKYPQNSTNNYGGKVLLPHTLLADLVTLNINPPYTFKIQSRISTYCGVLEFTAEEETVVVPEWMYNQLEMENNKCVVLSFEQLDMGRYVKLLPHTPRFLDIDNPKMELENVLVNYPILSLNDNISCMFDEYGEISFTVVEIEPNVKQGIYIVDTDLSVDFCEPLGYKEKIENERTVNKYLEVSEVDGIKIVRMKEMGLSFDL
ncbi:ubiquitin fusion degradation protein 1 [Vairimorpha apis BRL 01]|uniref:Ubiquitin fusion degradation protein 1 n=2 Tax=Vairimorpha apis BRL 01 TaxID=1037528 RepID=T0L6E6_9MICR|nr:ubiquitin fusion degradation protein 1 [Vairimorpha apis BRL 01]